MTVRDQIRAAGTQGRLLPETIRNLEAFIAAGLPDWATAAIEELVAREAWPELNDRFYRYLEFGTGGMRGRTIGVVTTAAEMGTPDANGAPEHAGIGSNLLNDYTVVRAVIGLYRYTRQYLDQRGFPGRASFVIAHDVRHFSRHFSRLAAATWTQLGGDAFVFGGPRPTPQLSFSVRWLRAHTGVVITASHNPPHDNGFKAYFEDGGQVVPPHDTGIVAEVNRVPLSEIGAYLSAPTEGITELDREADDAYLGVASQAVLDSAVFADANLRVAYSNIHGTGGVHAVPLLLHAGCHVHQVREQIGFDGRFPTVKSPNPENPEALSRALELADREGCEVVLATDPDADRMGCAVRNRAGQLQLLTGNQIGALLADYRLTKLKERRIIPETGSERVCLIKTFVTSRLLDAIGSRHGVKVVDTLTGFKWIGAKLRQYEDRLRSVLGPDFDYDAASLADRARLHQQHGTFYAFGCEESYGYLPNDLVRDKDGNAACLMFAELCAWVKGRGSTVPEYLDEIYLRNGYFAEGVINIYYEGASGNAKIRRILDSYRESPPDRFGDVAVSRFEDFGRQDIRDADGDLVPKQDLYQVTLGNGSSFAARGSGTEPKMKFYLFAGATVASADQLAAVKKSVGEDLEQLKRLVEADARRRAEG